MNKSDDDHEFDHFSDQVSRRQWYKRQPKSATQLVSNLISKKGYAETIHNEELHEMWLSIVSPPMAKRSRIGTVRRGTLEVFVENSTVLQELTFQKRTILKKLIATDESHGIKDLRFKVGPIT